ncbi:MAG: hypothetical protein HFE90_07825 [Firmicutes bacterium]|nr:hypothetical protein [Bacillota bacterium]
MKLILRIIAAAAVFITEMSCAVFAEDGNIVYNENESGYINIIIKDEDNIKAYEEADLIKNVSLQIQII